MNKLRLPLLLALCIAFITLFNACTSIQGTGPMVNVSRTTEEVKSIDLEMDAKVYLVKGDSQSIVIRGQQNIVDVLLTEVSSGKLEIKSKESISVNEPIQIWITLRQLESVELSGSGSIESDTEFNGEKIDVELSGSGKISLLLNAEKVYAELSGSGDMVFHGKVNKGEFELDGSGNIQAEAMEIEKCKVVLGGSGEAKVKVNGELEARIDGSGNIYYSGNPQKVKSDVNGSGRIEKTQ